MSYVHNFGSMYEDSWCMIFSSSCMIDVDYDLYHDPYGLLHLLSFAILFLCHWTNAKDMSGQSVVPVYLLFSRFSAVSNVSKVVHLNSKISPIPSFR